MRALPVIAALALASCGQSLWARGRVDSIALVDDAEEARQDGCWLDEGVFGPAEPPRGQLFFIAKGLGGRVGEHFEFHVERDGQWIANVYQVALEEDDWMAVDLDALEPLEHLHLTGRIYADQTAGLSMPRAVLVSESPPACFQLDVAPEQQ